MKNSARNKTRIVSFLKKRGIRDSVSQHFLTTKNDNMDITIENIESFKQGFRELEKIHPKPASAFKVHFRFISEVLLENMTDEHINELVRSIQCYAQSYGISFEKDQNLEYGWCTNMEASPILTAEKKQCIGLIDAAFNQAALAALKSVFQQMEPEML